MSFAKAVYVLAHVKTQRIVRSFWWRTVIIFNLSCQCLFHGHVEVASFALRAGFLQALGDHDPFTDLFGSYFFILLSCFYNLFHVLARHALFTDLSLIVTLPVIEERDNSFAKSALVLDFLQDCDELTDSGALDVIQKEGVATASPHIGRIVSEKNLFDL